MRLFLLFTYINLIIMKKRSTMIVVALVAVVVQLSVVMAQNNQSFLRQNLNNAPELPWLNRWIYDVNTQAQSAVDRVIGTISGLVNWVLGLLALISLIILIYTGVKMLLNSSDDKAIDEWYKTAKNIFIALLFIGASWLIVQFIFYVVKLFVG